MEYVLTTATSYNATKTMQLAIARSLAELTKGTEVTVNSLLPDSTRTESVIDFIQDVFDDESLSAEAAEQKFMAENRPTSLIQLLYSGVYLTLYVFSDSGIV